uniref:AlNc14C186G8330 protein n=1 Tax=Albugo laibachii Nc14 TaxID=890382 RepID=F0WPI5_9STRA|nr:AlNc14C186G8330 [Albugo laibachii Nc14]|eukprot:CCA23233.1 AlNc14C186G8330 [Albugo laibachii Nc14]
MNVLKSSTYTGIDVYQGLQSCIANGNTVKMDSCRERARSTILRLQLLDEVDYIVIA